VRKEKTKREKFDMSKVDISLFQNVFKRGGLAQKLGLLILLILIVPIFIIDVISVTTSVNSVLHESKKSYLAATDSTARYFQLAFKTAQNNGTQLMSNELIQRLYSESKQTALDDYEKFRLKTDADKAVQNTLVTNNMFSAVYILVNKEKSVFYPAIVFDINYDKIKTTPWYRKIIDAGAPILIESHNEEFDAAAKKANANMPEYACSIGMPFKDIATNDVLGVMLLDISKQWFRDTLQDTQISQQGGYMLAISPEGQVVLPTDWDLRMKVTPDKNTPFVSKILQSIKANKTNGAFDTVFDKNQFLITYSQVPDYNWTIVGMVPLSHMMGTARKLEVIIILLTIVFTLAALVIGIYYAWRIVKEIAKVTKTLAVAEKGDLTVSLEINRSDDIGLLSHSFTNMVKNIKAFIEKGVKLSEQVTGSISTFSTIPG